MDKKGISKEKLVSNLYSRQVGLYGFDIMKKIMKLNVLIYGMRGLGIEIAKNIILAGPNKVTIFDQNIVKINDLTANFYLTKEDVDNKRRRDESVLDKLSLLNPYVRVEIMKGNNVLENILRSLEDKESKYDVVLFSEFVSPEEIIKINEVCRNNNIGFIYTSELGIFGFCFVDFGDNFKVIDENGKEPLKYFVKSITKEKKGVVTVDTKTERLKLGKNKKVTFKDIEGMTELNNYGPVDIKILTDDSLEIFDTSNFSDYKSGGIMTEFKCPKDYHFHSLKERFEIPYTEKDKIPEQTDASKENTNEIIHVGLLALNKYYKENNCLPELNNEKQSQILLAYGKEIYKNKKDLFWLNGIEEEFEDFNKIFEKVLMRLSLWARSEVSPISSFLGGISAQEIVKYTGKYVPIYQWLWFDFSETVENLNSNIERNLVNDRYDDQIAIYGNKIQNKLSNINLFIIGAGALGCEFLKTFSLMGISTNKNKNVTITDNDNIEISNLNRQFLFKHDNVGEPKSIIASNEVKKINKDFNVYPMNSKVGIETEDIFNEEFWEKQDFIINAVDNLDARIYISEQSIIFRKILIDSGTLGTFANSQVIVPFKTIEYFLPKRKNNEQRDIAMCTIRNYPTSIEHCIEWARDNFNDYFVDVLQQLKMYFQNKNEFFKELEKSNNIDGQINVLKNIIKYSKLIINKSYDDCLEIAFNEYNKKFNNEIIQMITDHPPDSLNEDGSKFWNINKRIPIPLPFNTENDLIILYVKKYADILANSLSLPINKDNEYIKKKCLSFENPKFIPIDKKNIKNTFSRRYNIEKETNEKKLERKKKKIEEIEKRLKKQKENYEMVKAEVNKIEIPNYNNIGDIFNIKEFDKDDDKIGHIEFLYAASNLRAINFRIDKCDIYKVKMIAGNIVPAIATTTAGIVGLVSLQLYSLIENNDIQFVRDCNINMTYNHHGFISPVPCKNIYNVDDSAKIINLPQTLTVWDFLEIRQSFTIEEFIEYILMKYKLNILSISCNNLNLYEAYLNTINKNNKIEDTYSKISKIKIIDKKTFLILDIIGKIKDRFVKTPRIKYIFKEN